MAAKTINMTSVKAAMQAGSGPFMRSGESLNNPNSGQDIVGCWFMALDDQKCGHRFVPAADGGTDAGSNSSSSTSSPPGNMTITNIGGSTSGLAPVNTMTNCVDAEWSGDTSGGGGSSFIRCRLTDQFTWAYAVDPDVTKEIDVRGLFYLPANYPPRVQFRGARTNSNGTNAGQTSFSDQIWSTPGWQSRTLTFSADADPVTYPFPDVRIMTSNITEASGDQIHLAGFLFDFKNDSDNGCVLATGAGSESAEDHVGRYITASATYYADIIALITPTPVYGFIAFRNLDGSGASYVTTSYIPALEAIGDAQVAAGVTQIVLEVPHLAVDGMSEADLLLIEAGIIDLAASKGWAVWNWYRITGAQTWPDFDASMNMDNGGDGVHYDDRASAILALQYGWAAIDEESSGGGKFGRGRNFRNPARRAR